MQPYHQPSIIHNDQEPAGYTHVLWAKKFHWLSIILRNISHLIEYHGNHHLAVVHHHWPYPIVCAVAGCIPLSCRLLIPCCFLYLFSALVTITGHHPLFIILTIISKPIGCPCAGSPTSCSCHYFSPIIHQRVAFPIHRLVTAVYWGSYPRLSINGIVHEKLHSYLWSIHP